MAESCVSLPTNLSVDVSSVLEKLVDDIDVTFGGLRSKYK